MTTTPAEAQRTYDTLTRRIAAVDADIASEMDSERRATLQERKTALKLERDAITSSPQGSTDGVLDKLHRDAVSLNQTTEAYPIETHDLIKRTTDEMQRLDDRVTALERWRDPPPIVTGLRAMSVAIMAFSAVFMMLPANRLLLLQQRPEIGMIMGLITAALAYSIWRRADTIVRGPK